jgi:hypothetical protein
MGRPIHLTIGGKVRPQFWTISGVILLSSVPLAGYGDVSKCVDPRTKAVTYTNTGCGAGSDTKKVDIIDSGVVDVDGSAAKRNAENRKAIKAELAARAAAESRAAEVRVQGAAVAQAYADSYRMYQEEAHRIGYPRRKADKQNLARAAVVSQNLDAVDDALRLLPGTDKFTEALRIELQGCKLALQRGGQCR